MEPIDFVTHLSAMEHPHQRTILELWLVTNDFIKSLNLSVPRHADIRDQANSLLPAFLQILLTCFSKLRIASIKTPNISPLVNS